MRKQLRVTKNIPYISHQVIYSCYLEVIKVMEKCNLKPLRAIDIYRPQRSHFLTITVFQPMQPELPVLSRDVMQISV